MTWWVIIILETKKSCWRVPREAQRLGRLRAISELGRGGLIAGVSVDDSPGRICGKRMIVQGTEREVKVL